MGDIIDQDYLTLAFDPRRVAALSNDGSGAKATVIASAIEAAEAEIRNLLSRQYTLAQLQADGGIKRCVAITTMYILELRRADQSKGIIDAYQNSLAFLQRIVEGDAKLAAVEEILPRITHTNAEQVFESSGYFAGYPSSDD